MNAVQTLIFAALAAASQDQALQDALECRQLADDLDPALMRLAVPLDGSALHLQSPVSVYGHPARRIAVFRDGGTDLYTSWIEGVPLQQLADHAGLAPHDGFYEKSTAIGSLTLTADGDAAMLRCTVDFH